MATIVVSNLQFAYLNRANRLRKGN